MLIISPFCKFIPLPCSIISFVLGRSITRTTITPSLGIIRKGLTSSANCGSTAFISNQQQLSVDYLINSCGLSPESALKASKRILLRSPTTNPDSVLSLFKTYGFTQPQISRLISERPSLLLAKPDKTLKPKLDYLNSIGISGPNLGKFLINGSGILHTNLEKSIIPSINFLRNFVSANRDIALVIKRMCLGIRSIDYLMGPNITVLHHHGVPNSNIGKFLVWYTRDFCVESVRFEKTLTQVKKLGVDSSETVFLRCLHVLLWTMRPIWDAKLTVYRSFGWSEDEVLSVFKRQPFVMGASVKKLKLALDFFMNTLKWTRGDIAKNPTVILLSLRKRIIPRCHVLQILVSKGLINKTRVGSGLNVTEDVFLERFVARYQEELPDLLKVYQSKVIGTENNCEIEKL